MTIKKKIWPESFERILSGKKKFEVRLGDFEVKEGDTIILEEWDPKTEKYTGRSAEVVATYIIDTKDMPFWPKEEIEKKGLKVISIDLKS